MEGTRPKSAFAPHLLRINEAIRGFVKWRRYGLAIGLGVLSALALAPFYFLPLMVVGGTALVWLIDAAAGEEKRFRKSFFVGWCYGFGYFLTSMYWLGFAFMVQAEQFAWMAPFAVLGMPAFLALFVGGFVALAVRFWHSGPSRVLLLVAAISASEFVRGHILTGLPWNLMGQAFAGQAITAQLAAFIGPYGLSLVALTLAMLLGGVISRRQIRKRPAWIWAGGLVLVYIVGALRLLTPVAVEPDTVVMVVQPNIAQRDKIDPAKSIDNFRQLLKVTQQGLDKVDIGVETIYVAWPENAAPWLAERSRYLDAIAELLPPEAVLLTGAVRQSIDEAGKIRYFNAMLVVEDTTGELPAGLPLDAVNQGLFRKRSVVKSYDKHHLVPFGEYLPFKNILKAIGLAQLAPMADGFTPGQGPTTLDLGRTKVAPNICYETVFPMALYPRNNRPDWLLTVTNDAWFGDNAGPQQHLDQARLRAIESGLPFFRSANTGISAAIGPFGRLIETIPLYEEGVFVQPLPMAAKPTIYAKVGNIPYVLLWVLWALWGANKLPHFTRNRRNDRSVS